MECLSVATLPEGPGWTWEIKLDGWRMEVVKSAGRVTLYSRRGKNFNAQFGYIAEELDYLPDETVDGEIVALDEEGRPTFNLLQNFRSEESRIMYFAFDIPIHNGHDLMRRPLSERREVLRSIIRADGQHVVLSQPSDRPLAQMMEFIRTHGLEGIVAKRADSFYQPGQRTGVWEKHRFNRSQEFVIGGYVPSGLGVDALVVGFYRNKKLHYAARVRAGFVPATRRQVFAALKHLATMKCPFVNLPEKEPGRWGQGLTAEKMQQCVWLKPEAVAEVGLLEWTDGDHLRHTKFIRLRDDKNPRQAVRET